MSSPCTPDERYNTNSISPARNGRKRHDPDGADGSNTDSGPAGSKERTGGPRADFRGEQSKKSLDPASGSVDRSDGCMEHSSARDGIVEDGCVGAVSEDRPYRPMAEADDHVVGEERDGDFSGGKRDADSLAPRYRDGRRVEDSSDAPGANGGEARASGDGPDHKSEDKDKRADDISKMEDAAHSSGSDPSGTRRDSQGSSYADGGSRTARNGGDAAGTSGGNGSHRGQQQAALRDDAMRGSIDNNGRGLTDITASFALRSPRLGDEPEKSESLGRDKRSDDQYERDTRDSRRERSRGRRGDSRGAGREVGRTRESRDCSDHGNRNNASGVDKRGEPVDSRRADRDRYRRRDDSRDRGQYGGDRAHSDALRGFSGGRSRDLNWPRDRPGDVIRGGSRDRDRFQAGDRNGKRECREGGKPGTRGRDDSHRRGNYVGERRSEEWRGRSRRDDSRDRNGYRNGSGRGGGSWGSGDARPRGRGRDDRPAGRRDWQRDGRNNGVISGDSGGVGGGGRNSDFSRDSRDRGYNSWGASRGSRERLGGPTTNADRESAHSARRERSSSSSSAGAVGIRDGQWVGAAVGSNVVSRNGPGGEARPGEHARNPTPMMGFVSASKSPPTQSAPVGAAKAAAVAATTQADAVSGDTPRRPRWDKAKPGASSSTVGSAAPQGKQSVPGGQKKLVWGGASGGNVAGQKRTLWAAMAGGEDVQGQNGGGGAAVAVGSGDATANQQEQKWQAAAAALGPADRQVKFLRLLGAKGAAAAAAGSASAAPTSPENAIPEGGNPTAAAGTQKVMQDLEIQYQKAHRAHYGYQRGLGK